MKSNVDLSNAYVVHSKTDSGPLAKAIEVLLEEIEKRTGMILPEAYGNPGQYTSAIVVGTKAGLNEMISGYVDVLSDIEQLNPEGYLLQVIKGLDTQTLLIIGADARGVLYGVGKFLRKSRLKERSIQFAADLKLVSSPQYPIRGHQLGYRPKTNAYDAWTVEQFDQYIRELALFGANSIEILPPRTDDALTGPLMKLDPMEMMIRLSAIIDSYGLNVWIWYPNMAEDYTDSRTRKIELDEREEVFSKLLRIDAVLIPGSDPGGMEPDPLFDWSEEVSRLLNRYHRSAKVWLAPQVMKYESKPWLEGFYRNVNLEPHWLGGVVYGPHVDEMLPDFREKIPQKYPIRRYEDITHNYFCQYPVENWDLSFALTLGRECFNPRPVSEKHIHNVFAPFAQGNISYSEGINDDVNKFIWSDQDWNPETPVMETLRDYARLLIDCNYAEAIARGLMSLEQNWIGPLAVNERVEVTLQQWMDMEEEASTQILNNYRFQMGLMRAYYDAYIKRRLIYETELEYKAKDALRSARAIGSLAALDRAEQALRLAHTELVAQDYKQRCNELAEELFRNIGSQLTVERHSASAVGRGAFMDTIDHPLNDVDFLLTQFSKIRELKSEEIRLKQIHDLLNRANPGPGGYYDSLGSYSCTGKVDPGMGWKRDPGFLQSSRVAQATYLLTIKQEYKTELGGIPLAWVNVVNTMTDTPITVSYDNLDPDTSYAVKVTYVGDTINEEQARDTWVSMTVNDHYRLHDNLLVGQGSGVTIESLIPQEALAFGKIKLTFMREKGFKRLNVAEIWIIPQKG